MVHRKRKFATQKIVRDVKTVGKDVVKSLRSVLKTPAPRKRKTVTRKARAARLREPRDAA